MAYARELEAKVGQVRAETERLTGQTASSSSLPIAQLTPATQNTEMGQGMRSATDTVEMLVCPGNDYVYRIPYSSEHSNIFYGRLAYAWRNGHQTFGDRVYILLNMQHL
ncbi:hypothetical protein AC579_9450 [Pseudocercospora musae]|uniref:Uncharacterized protein n=1 Tax=Pseudocercospora musae TaxID=113226 RepID=A0A139HBI0_9PEZI|nr:hypothetical protein AC579_9450 [Pseudocercospora musae]